MGDSDVTKFSKTTNLQLLLDDKATFPSYIQQHDPYHAVEKTQLTIYHQNIHGLKCKINEFILTLTEVKPHLIFLSEHHLNTLS